MCHTMITYTQFHGSLSYKLLQNHSSFGLNSHFFHTFFRYLNVSYEKHILNKAIPSNLIDYMTKKNIINIII